MKRCCAIRSRDPSSITSVPMMSDGIRSGVNWMRLNFKCTASASVLISSVFRQAGHAAQQAMTAGEERGEDFLDHLILANDDAAKLLLKGADQAGRLGQTHLCEFYRLRPSAFSVR
jgi:hypothetical protein